MKNRWPIPPGIISLVVCFAALCLAILSLLTFTSAKTEYNLASASYENTQSILDADYLCKGKIAEAYTLFENGENINQIALELECDLIDNILVFTQAIDENRAIVAEVTFADTPSLTSYRTLYIGDWTPDNSLGVWEGQ